MINEKNQNTDKSKYNESESSNGKRKKVVYMPKWLFFSGVSAIVLSSFMNYFIHDSNSKLKKEKEELINQNVSYQEIIENNNQEIANLRELNKESINNLQGRIEDLKQQMPVRGLFESLERLVGGIGLFNENPMSTEKLDKIKMESQSYPENFEEVWDEWKLKTHGLNNYIPKVSWLIPPKIGDGENTVVQQDFGKNVYIMILGEGHHYGIDLTNKSSRKLYSSFDGTVIEDRDYSGKGRNITIQADNKDEDYRYRMSIFHLDNRARRFRSGQKIKQGDYLADYGSTGFVSGAHLHVEFLRSANGRNWEFFDAFENKTYKEGENIVWFNFWNVPESMKELIKKRIYPEE